MNMRAEILGVPAPFEVQLEDGRPPAEVTLTLRLCWQRPPVEMRVVYLYTNEETRVAVYARKGNK